MGPHPPLLLTLSTILGTNSAVLATLAPSSEEEENGINPQQNNVPTPPQNSHDPCEGPRILSFHQWVCGPLAPSEPAVTPVVVLYSFVTSTG